MRTAMGPWQVSPAMALSQCYVHMLTHTYRHQGRGGERMVPARALWCATHTKHPASETWVLQPSPLGRRDAEGTGHLFSLTALSRPVFFLCLQFFAHLLMPISKASPHQPKRTQSSGREPTDHATQSQNPMSILRCLPVTGTANPNGKIQNSHSS